MEPFSTSALKDLTRVFATTTKICTSGGSRPAHAAPFDAHRHDPPTRRGFETLEAGPYCPDGRVSGGRLSAIHFQG